MDATKDLSQFQVGVSRQSCLPFAKTSKTSQTGVVQCEYCRIESTYAMSRHKEESGSHIICPLCHCCLHLDAAGSQNAGIMIWMPELTQAQLNAVVSVIFAAIASNPNNKDDPEVSKMRAFYGVLEARAQQIDTMFGGANSLFKATHPLFMAQQIDHINFKLGKTVPAATLAARLDGIRFLALPTPFMELKSRPTPFMENKYVQGVAKVLMKRYPRDTWDSLIPDIAPAQGQSAFAESF